MEIGQLREACMLMRKYEGVEPEEILPRALPDTPVTFEPNKGYVRDILASQIDLRLDGLGYTPVDDLASESRFFAFQGIVNRAGTPSEQVVDMDRERSGSEYRDQDAEHPIADLRAHATT